VLGAPDVAAEEYAEALLSSNPGLRLGLFAADRGADALAVAGWMGPLNLEKRVAAEHFAFCPDNVWQGSPPYTLAGYAERLLGATAWQFWWG
jgi:hypothetical protein